MAGVLDGRKIAFLVANEGIERVELVQPWSVLEKAGGDAALLAIEEGTVKTVDHLDPASTHNVDLAVAKADVADFDALVLPGGVANPDKLRTDPDAVAFVKAFVESGKPVAAICHAPWILIEADVVRGRTLTSYPSLKTDVRNAGGTWVDQEVVTDGNLVTSRNPDDLPAFSARIVELLTQG